jgi:hypothetical protein
MRMRCTQLQSSGYPCPKIARSRPISPPPRDPGNRVRHLAAEHGVPRRSRQGEKVEPGAFAEGPRDAILPEVGELRLELPYDFTSEQYVQILTDFVERIAPELGWRASVDPFSLDRSG